MRNDNEIKTILTSYTFITLEPSQQMLRSMLSLVGDVLAGSKPWSPRGLGDMLKRNWYLGFTSFGGPAVHFQIVLILIRPQV